MNTLNIEFELSQKYGYKPLPKELSSEYKKFFTENIPEFLKLEGDNNSLCTLGGTLLCNGYKRIIVGDYGAFVEFDVTQANLPFAVKKGQEFRIKNPHFAATVKYE